MTDFLLKELSVIGSYSGKDFGFDMLFGFFKLPFSA